MLAVAALGLAATSCGSKLDDTPPDDPAAIESPAPTPTAPAEPPPPDEPEEPPPTAEPEPEPDAEPEVVRGAWVHLFDDALKSRAGIVAVVDELAGAGANTIVAQVARRHDAYYRSAYLPPTADPQLEADLDVLGELLRVAHDRGLAVHAWIAVAPTWHPVYDDLPRPPGWLPADHGLAAVEEQRWVTRAADGTWSDYLDPALPEVQDHVVATVLDIVRNYAVDGIHLDYVRYASEQHGYHPRALDRFRAETGAIGTPEPRDAAWSQWRRDRVTELVAGVADAVDEAAPEVLLSAALIAWGEGPGGSGVTTFHDTRTYRDALQDWESWARDGLVDVLMPMVYFREADSQQAGWFTRWTDYQRALNAETDARIVPGVGGWLNAPAATVDQTVRSMGVGDGAMVYSYQQPTADESREVWRELADRRWGQPAP
ncbi:glycoside hydrolase family 10 protein [Nitriliruptor alkaliphilus]|uniref:glycoside hydrolase family 10 protein n=1 Tax=Nitriliruptor alkaliphilus TaxID=427918 RepID=UPI000697F409|nr:family 10 glycosylhydrolase [Nitriliruptor alkaliphilus]